MVVLQSPPLPLSHTLARSFQRDKQMENPLDKYRETLLATEQKAQEDFDKTILTLSGSALGVTFAFIKDIVGDKPIINSDLIFFAWLSWGISISAVLLSYYFSHLALRKAIKQVDNGEIYKSHPGGLFDLITGILNALSGILFLVGVILAALFAQLNLGA
ncbi:hypothetical protein D6779_03325 [Candidatus Parcubacteria bacterium]|nr:MAG: hypothetical protein D6779_03325 [Candidatus Parcubacteria bacterium]